MTGAAPAAPAAARPSTSPGRTPLVAVCGLAGGAGTTTLAWLLAREVLAGGGQPVLLAELPSAAGGLAALTATPPVRTLARLAAEPPATRSWPPAPDGPPGLHLAMAEAAPASAAQLGAAVRALAEARSDHAAVIADCGRLHAEDARAMLVLATHIVWTVPAGPRAGPLVHALLLGGRLVPPPGAATEVLAVVAVHRGPLPARGQRALRQAAAERAERVVLIPHAPALARDATSAKAPRRVANALSALAGVLRRAPAR